MPTPRRPISALSQDAAGTIPVAVPRVARLERYAHETRRCERCFCILARDQSCDACSPCQKYINRVLYESERYQSEKPGG